MVPPTSDRKRRGGRPSYPVAWERVLHFEPISHKVVPQREQPFPGEPKQRRLNRKAAEHRRAPPPVVAVRRVGAHDDPQVHPKPEEARREEELAYAPGHSPDQAPQRARRRGDRNGDEGPVGVEGPPAERRHGKAKGHDEPNVADVNFRRPDL